MTDRHALERRTGTSGVARIVSLYGGFAAFWVLVVDAIVDARLGEHDASTVMRAVPDIAFLAVSALILYVLIRRLVLAQGVVDRSDPDPELPLPAGVTTTKTLSDVVEHCSEAIVIADWSATIEYVNPAAALASGYSREELIGRHARVLLSGTTPLSTLREMREQLAAGRPWKGHFHNRRKDGSAYVESAIVLPIAGDGEATRFVAIKEDVTTRNRMSDELERYCHQLEALVDRRTAELDLVRKGSERANRSVGEILGQIEQKLRAPLDGMQEYVERLHASGLAPSQARLADEIRDAARALRQSVDHLVDDSASAHHDLQRAHFPEATGAPDPTPRAPADVAPAGEGHAGNVGAQDIVEPARAALAVDVTVLPRLVGNDTEVLRQLQDEYVASARRIAGDLREAAARADWKVVGWLVHRLKSSSRSIGALALGDVCERIEAAAGDGDPEAIRALIAIFDVALAEVVAFLSAGPCGADGGRPAVLIVDDDPLAIEIMTRQLVGLHDGRVGAATSGARALQLLAGHDSAACLLLLDLNMPGMDGVELMRHLAASRYAGALVLISGADDRILETAFRLGKAYRLNILGHVHKPVATSRLQALLEQWRGSAPVPATSTPVPARYAAADLRHAIDEGQFLLHYQPKVSMSDGTLKGVEALLRWQHPVDGMVLPGAFVDLAERHGLIDEMTRLLLPRALRETAGWRREGLQLQVAFNVSMDSLRRVEFSEFVLEELARAGVAPGDLCLEVTESRLPDDMRAPMEVLTRLRMNGVSLSIDDFGTGHSSLAKLRDMPFDELKIDRGFVHGSGNVASQRAIFVASLRMAHELGMRAVAEGVEDAADWDFVRVSGCDLGQGYLVGKAMPADALAAWAAGWASRRISLIGE